MDSSLPRSSDNIATAKVWHPTLLQDQHMEQYGWRGHPWHPLPLTDPAGVTALGLYPNDGDGILDAASAGGGTLDATGVPTTVDLTGFVICIIAGTGIGQVRKIATYTTATRVFTVSPNWTVTPTGATYVVGLETIGRGQLTVKAEFEGSGDTVDVHPVLFGYPLNVNATGDLGMSGGTGRAPIRGLGRRLSFFAFNYQVGITQSGLFHAENVLTEYVRGATLAKLYLRTQPAGGRKVALYAGAT